MVWQITAQGEARRSTILGTFREHHALGLQPPTFQELAGLLHTSNPVIAHHIGRLVDAGMIERIGKPNTHRPYRLVVPVPTAAETPWADAVTLLRREPTRLILHYGDPADWEDA